MGEMQGKIGGSRIPAPSMETTDDFVTRGLVWYTRSIVDYVFAKTDAGRIPVERPHDILVVSHGGWISALLFALHSNGLVKCRKGVEIGPYLNTGVSIIEYAEVPTGRDEALVGTLVQYSDTEHLVPNGLHIQEVNVDLLEDSGRIP